MRRGHGARGTAVQRGALATALLVATPAVAHVALDAPNGGERYESGTTITVVWHVAVQHDLQDWDLEYSTTGENGPWLPLAVDLPAGDPTEGAVHTHDWVVPHTASDQLRVRVRQDNSGTDYYDTSDQDWSVVPLESTSRLRVLRLDLPRDLATVFRRIPCARISDLRICTEAPGTLETRNDPVLPLEIAAEGDLVLIELDTDLARDGSPAEIVIGKSAGGALIVESW